MRFLYSERGSGAINQLKTTTMFTTPKKLPTTRELLTDAVDELIEYIRDSKSAAFEMEQHLYDLLRELDEKEKKDLGAARTISQLTE